MYNVVKSSDRGIPWDAPIFLWLTGIFHFEYFY